jgi:plastocyanin
MLIVCVAAGCEQKKKIDKAPRPQPVFGNGVITGKVIFTGKPPRRETIDNGKCCEGAPRTLLDETVVTSDKGELANVVVYLSDISASEGSQQPPAVLDQKSCQYVPHVLAMQVGQTLTVTTSDPTPHNVHYTSSSNASANYGTTVPGDRRDVTFQASEFIPFRCDVHPWMKAHVAVMDNPFFAVTKEDGSFRIGKIPTGKYTLKAWHERFGELEQPITVTDAGEVTSNFQYKPETTQ